jgi:hypothetical protein
MKFRAQIDFGGKTRHIGLFNTIEEASEAYRNAAAVMFGEFANDGNLPISEAFIANAVMPKPKIRAVGATGIRGVSHAYGGKFKAMISIGGRVRYIGTFESAEIAAVAWSYTFHYLRPTWDERGAIIARAVEILFKE